MLCARVVSARVLQRQKHAKAECVHALKVLAMPRASHASEIALAGSRRLRSTLAAALVLFARTLLS